jgi:16S rRNA (guanine(527)-N(7))-methyltransferase RsmG
MSAFTEIKSLFSHNGLESSAHMLRNFLSYYELTAKWNKSINITRNTDPRSFVIENILDPLLAFQSLSSDHTNIGSTLIDIGCGGGFAGIVFHIAGEQRRPLLLVDKSLKRINFCKDVIRKLGLQNVSALNGAFENLCSSFPENATIISRATFNIEKLLCLSQKNLVQPPRNIISFETEASLINYFGLVDWQRTNTSSLNNPFSIVDKQEKQYRVCKYTIHPAGINRFIVITNI